MSHGFKAGNRKVWGETKALHDHVPEIGKTPSRDHGGRRLLPARLCYSLCVFGKIRIGNGVKSIFFIINSNRFEF